MPVAAPKGGEEQVQHEASPVFQEATGMESEFKEERDVFSASCIKKRHWNRNSRASDNEFHKEGAAKEKARRPISERISGMTSRLAPAERRLRVG